MRRIAWGCMCSWTWCTATSPAMRRTALLVRHLALLKSCRNPCCVHRYMCERVCVYTFVYMKGELSLEAWLT